MGGPVLCEIPFLFCVGCHLLSVLCWEEQISHQILGRLGITADYVIGGGVRMLNFLLKFSFVV